MSSNTFSSAAAPKVSDADIIIKSLNRNKKPKKDEKTQPPSPNSDKVKQAVDKVSIEMAPYKTLFVLAQEVITKLNELLKKELPEGVESLKPEEHTPDATAQRIADGSTALFPIYAKQHPELQGEKLLDSFMETIRGGIQSGYKSAMGTLDDIGALDINGVRDGIDETMKLVDEKLNAFADKMRESFNPAEKNAGGHDENSIENTGETEKAVNENN